MSLKRKYPLFENSLLIECLTRASSLQKFNKKIKTTNKHLGNTTSNSLSNISGLYLYTNTPPHGFGTQAPKVAESINRAYTYNKKPEGRRKLIINEFIKIERMNWEKEDGPFPFNETHGNFIPSVVREMSEEFLLKHQNTIDRCCEKTMGRILDTNADVLTKGRQTFCPFTNQSVTASVAFKRMHKFLSENSGIKNMSCLEFIKAYMMLFDKDELVSTKTETTEYDIKVYNPTTKVKELVTKKRSKMLTVKIEGREEVNKYLIQIGTRFASYIKHGERGKVDRRGIASGNMIIRMLLYIIEEFHLTLSDNIPGSTISKGGEEKKAKITSDFSDTLLETEIPDAISQGTEDATKWNECLCPAAFTLMHKTFFDDDTRVRLSLPRCSDLSIAFRRIASVAGFLMALKEIQLGQGVQVMNDKFYSRIQWNDEDIEKANVKTQKWYHEIKEHITEDRAFLRASPGFLMGMLNACSTTYGLISVNYRMDPKRMKVVTLRSSDDSMSLYITKEVEDNKYCIERNRRNLGATGINQSLTKSFMLKEGKGEYTSWYQDKKFIAQYGTETSSLKPQGKNPYDDLYALAKGTATQQSTLTINAMGASAKLRIGVDNIRRLWRISKAYGKWPQIKPEVQLIEDGGRNMWNSTNCHLEETSLKEHFITNDQEKEYMLRIRNPKNPFSMPPEEELTFSKEHGTMVLDVVEVPRNVFSYVKRTNRTVVKSEKKNMFDEEKRNGEAMEIIKLANPTVYLRYPNSRTNIAKSIKARIIHLSKEFSLSAEEELLVGDALQILDEGKKTDLLFEEDRYIHGGSGSSDDE